MFCVGYLGIGLNSVIKPPLYELINTWCAVLHLELSLCAKWKCLKNDITWVCITCSARNLTIYFMYGIWIPGETFYIKCYILQNKGTEFDLEVQSGFYVAIETCSSYGKWKHWLIFYIALLEGSGIGKSTVCVAALNKELTRWFKYALDELINAIHVHVYCYMWYENGCNVISHDMGLYCT